MKTANVLFVQHVIMYRKYKERYYLNAASVIKTSIKLKLAAIASLPIKNKCLFLPTCKQYSEHFKMYTIKLELALQLFYHQKTNQHFFYFEYIGKSYCKATRLSGEPLPFNNVLFRKKSILVVSVFIDFENLSCVNSITVLS